MSTQRIRDYFILHWQRFAGFGSAFVLIGIAMYWRLGSLVGSYSQGELATYASSLRLRTVLTDPINAPFLVIVRALTYLHPDSLVVTRVAATACGAGTLVLFALIVRKWHDTHTAVAATILFGLSAWFLHISRMGTPNVLMFGVFALAVCGYWLKMTNHWLALAACFVLATVLLYVPGMIWFIALALIWQWRVVDQIFKKHLITVSLAALAMIGALFPLGQALYKHHALIKPWLGLPATWPTPVEIGKNLITIPFHLFIRNGSSPAAWLGQAPILDVFSLVMFLLGVYLYIRHVRLARTPIFASVLVLTIGLMAIGSTITFSVVIPFIYLIAAAGLSYLINQWLTIFPRNPIARSIGWGMFATIIGIACAFQLTHYFVGWPHAQATRDVYTIQRP